MKIDKLSFNFDGEFLNINYLNENVKIKVFKNDIENVETIINDKEKKIIEKPTKTITVGDTPNTLRRVEHYLTKSNYEGKLRIGVTKHTAMGTWSSLPHDFELKPELGFEEFFMYLMGGKDDFALQYKDGIYFDGKEVKEIVKVYSGDIQIIPMGYHMVVGAPYTQVNYIWCYPAKYPHWEKV